MPRINLIGSSNLYTNNTCEYGSMAGLAPTTNVRPNITGLNGYKVAFTAANQHNNDGTKIASNTTALNNGCGLGKYGKKACTDGTRCLKHLNLWKGANTIGHFKPGRTKLLN
tara:strand:+ start:1317 stop:1652 length:336 start_codon:yes stop_codon:yes gene_type:complete